MMATHFPRDTLCKRYKLLSTRQAQRAAAAPGGIISKCSPVAWLRMHWLFQVGTLALTVVPFLAGCTAEPPYRILPTRAPISCYSVYEAASGRRSEIDQQSAKTMQSVQRSIKTYLAKHRAPNCWKTSWEHHKRYELYTVEFDDQGWLAGTDRGDIPRRTELSVMEHGLQRIFNNSGTRLHQPLDIIVYIHGWHHSAEPYDGNVIKFRELLSQTSRVEEKLCKLRWKDWDKHHKTPSNSGKLKVCHAGIKITKVCHAGRKFGDDKLCVPNAWLMDRQVVGIYVGWRGESISVPYLNLLTIWGRKHAADTVSSGSVQQLFAWLHAFYIRYDCHVDRLRHRTLAAFDKCADVHLLTIGHSFGGLIAYRALAPRILMGIAETKKKYDGHPQYAYGFGDLTVLVNPAFEATRFEALAEAAAERSYDRGGGSSGDCNYAQLPVLIVATSKTDRATHYFFPLFRWMTTRFQEASGAEKAAILKTVGWDSRYQNHTLRCEPKPNSCKIHDRESLGSRIRLEVRWLEGEQRQCFVPFGGEDLKLQDSLELTQTKQANESAAIKPRAFLPIWVIKAGPGVINGHDDYLDPHFVNFVRQIYTAVLMEEDAREILQLKSRKHHR